MASRAADLFVKVGISRLASICLDVRLFARELALAGNALVRVGGPLDPVLKFAAPLGQLPCYHVASAACAPIREVWGECDLLASLKLVLCHPTVLWCMCVGMAASASASEISIHDCAAASEARDSAS